MQLAKLRTDGPPRWGASRRRPRHGSQSSRHGSQGCGRMGHPAGEPRRGGPNPARKTADERANPLGASRRRPGIRLARLRTDGPTRWGASGLGEPRDGGSLGTGSLLGTGGASGLGVSSGLEEPRDWESPRDGSARNAADGRREFAASGCPTVELWRRASQTERRQSANVSDIPPPNVCQRGKSSRSPATLRNGRAGSPAPARTLGPSQRPAPAAEAAAISRSCCDGVLVYRLQLRNFVSFPSRRLTALLYGFAFLIACGDSGAPRDFADSTAKAPLAADVSCPPQKPPPLLSDADAVAPKVR